MKILKEYKPEMIVSKDKSRYMLNYCYLQGEYLYATDGKKMVRIKVTLDENDKDGFIPKIAFDLARKNNKLTHLDISLNGKVNVKTLDGNIAIDCELQGEFPVCENAIPKGSPKWRIGLNATLLKQLSDSMGILATEGITLEVIEENKAIIVKPLRKDNRVFGILMPMRVD